MKLEIEQREKEGIFILDLKGRLVLGDEDLAVRHQLQTLLDSGHVNVIVNLKDVSVLDSTGMGTLLNGAMRFHDAGGKLALLHLSSSNATLPDVMKLNALFETYQDEVSALNSFFPDRKIKRYDILDFVEEQEQLESAGRNKAATSR